MSTMCAALSTTPPGHSSLRARCVMLQNRNSIHPAENRADMRFTIIAAFDGSSVKSVKKLPINMKKGAPGGWPTSSLYAVVMNSGQSQKLAVGSIVEQYVKAATAKISQPTMLLTSLYCFISGVRCFFMSGFMISVGVIALFRAKIRRIFGTGVEFGLF